MGRHAVRNTFVNASVTVYGYARITSTSHRPKMTRVFRIARDRRNRLYILSWLVGTTPLQVMLIDYVVKMWPVTQVKQCDESFLYLKVGTS